MTTWTADPAADPSTTFATPTQGSVASHAWWNAMGEQRDFDIQFLTANKHHTTIQLWSATVNGISIQEMSDARTTWS